MLAGEMRAEKSVRTMSVLEAAWYERGMNIGWSDFVG